MTLDDWLAHIERQHARSVELGLERVQAVRDHLGRKQSCPVILVGGTNGKGSTCALLERILLCAGYRVGLYTSPHLIDYNERVRVDGRPASDEALCGVDGRKMSKSYDNAIFLSDIPEAVQQKIMTMMTDPARVKRTDKGTPELSPVYHLHKILSSKQEQDEVVKGCITAGIGCIDCKKILLKNIFSIMKPIWQRRNELLNNPDMLDDIVKRGTEKATKTVEETMQLVRDAMGLY